MPGGIGLTTIPSIIAYWTHSLWLCKLMFCIFIPAIYFYIGPCFGLLNNLAPCHMRNMFIAISLLVANIFNLIVAPWVVGFLSDWFAGTPRVRMRRRCAWRCWCLAPTGFWAAYHLYHGVAHHHRGSEARHRLHHQLGALSIYGQDYASTGAGCP